MTHDPSECIIVAVSELQMARQALDDDIRNYPTPIAGCDAQFNHLLVQRQKVHEALAALNASAFIPTPRQLHPGARMESR